MTTLRERMAVAACESADCHAAGECCGDHPEVRKACGALADRCLAASGRAELVAALRNLVRGAEQGEFIPHLANARALLAKEDQ